MAFNINNYHIKHLVSLNPDFINETRIDLDIEGRYYDFKCEEVRTSVMEFVHYCRYSEIKSKIGPLEEKLNEFTHGKSFNQLNDYQRFDIKKSKFKVDIFDNTYELEITGVGPVALKISLFITFKRIETEDKPLERMLKQSIINIYSKLIENNPRYEEKLEELKNKSDAEEERQAKIKEEVKREREEKERKMKELEEMLNSNKPKNNERPFKMY